MGSVFEESQDAVIFKGEDFGFNTRVFITSAGLPTYETKDLGVVMTEYDDFNYDRRIVMTGNDQAEYMKVVFAAVQQLNEELAAKQTNLTNGMVRFGDGKKMSSRLGNVLPAKDVIKTVQAAVVAPNDQLRQDITTGALRYTFLKQRIGGDIAFDVTESVSLQGNSGPYLQYAHARARSILAKASLSELPNSPQFQADERSLVRKLSQYSTTLEQSVNELAPHLICTYLYELAQNFNHFYEHNRVLGDKREALRLSLVKLYAQTLADGLAALNIPAPQHL
jgi:arginyl-tRNA synthetase